MSKSKSKIKTDELEQTKPTFECYSHESDWWSADDQGTWRVASEKHIKRELASRGFCSVKLPNQNQSEVEEYLRCRRNSHALDYVGPLAGYGAGLRQMCGSRVLVTHSPTHITPREGDWSVLRAVLEGLLDSGTTPQSAYFHAWLKTAWEALKSQQWIEGQVMVLVGPAGCGKSLVQNLITQILGGREAKPMAYLTGNRFNDDLLGAEHLKIEDEQITLGGAEKHCLGERLKGLCVNQKHRCEGKFLKAVMLSPIWRVTMSLNDQGEQIAALPSLDAGLKDKLIILKCETKAPPMPNYTSADRRAYDKALEDSLPGYLHWVTSEFQVPDDLKSGTGRYGGLKEFHHPSVLDSLANCSKEEVIMHLVDEGLFTLGNTTERRGTAAKHQTDLLGVEGAVGYQAKKILTYTNAMASVLTRLSENPKYQDRVKKAPNFGQNREWIIYPPAGQPDRSAYSYSGALAEIRKKWEDGPALPSTPSTLIT